MRFVFGAAAGLVWGALAAYLNLQINKKALAKNSTNALLAANLARTAVDIAALGLIVLLRSFLPFRYEAALVGTAIALSLLTIVFAYRLSRPESPAKKAEDEEKTDEQE